ncbi:class I SAM-dependent methyltransferase, partial [archaeon]
MSIKVLSQFLNAPFLILFTYCCYLQYQLIQLSWQQQGVTPGITPRGPVVPYSVQNLLFQRSPPNMPPLALPAEEDQKINRDIYGGKGDPKHLGGFITRDNETISYNLWNFMISELSVKSIVDVGCGKGFSSRFFYERGLRVTCVEGSADAVKQSLVPQ